MVVVVLAMAAIAASVGTCSRFSGDHPTSREVEVVAGRSVEAVFTGHPASRIRPGMLAAWRGTGMREGRVGRVTTIETTDNGLRVTATFPQDLPAVQEGILSIDTSLPPEVLK